METIADPEDTYALFSNPEFVKVMERCNIELEQGGTVDLGGEMMGDIGAEAVVSAIMGKYAKMSHLLCKMLTLFCAPGEESCTDLNVEMNEIGDEGCEAIAKLLFRNKSLATLNMNNNKIGAKGARAIAEALSDEHCSLKVLEFEQNEFKTVGARTLAVALRNNESLEILCLNWNKIASAGKIFAK